MLAISAQAERRVARLEEMIRWPLSPNDDWRKGFLAGIFDAEGSCGREALRISNKDRLILDWTTSCLRHFRFDCGEEPPRPNGVTCIRIRGGLRERLRFFHLTDPAITRKRTVQGMALKSDAKTRVMSVEPLGMAMRLYDITTGTGDFIANGVVSHNCFARPTHTYLDFNAGRDFEKEIVVKVNVPEVLRVELARPSWKGEHVAMGTNTDPYQWVEGRYKLMRGIWEALRDAANPCSVLTKSPLLLRDLDLMKEIADVADISANLSVPTIDEKAWRASEPHTPNPRARLEAVGELNRAGIPTGVLVAPLMPGINDDPAPGGGDPAGGGRRRGDGRQRHRAAPAGRGARHLHGVAAVLPAGPRRALRGALCTRRVPAARRAGADRRAHPTGADGDAGAAVRRLPARARSGLRADVARRIPEPSGHRGRRSRSRPSCSDRRVARGRSVTTVTALVAIPTGQGGVVLVRKRSSQPRPPTHEETLRHPKPLLA